MQAESTLTPPPVRQPIQWRRAWRAIQALRADHRRVEYVYEVMIALDGGQTEAMFQAFLAEGNGPRLLAERPSLLQTLSDFDTLRQLPEGSLGRAYLALMEQTGYDPDGLHQASRLVAGLDELLPGPERKWYIERNSCLHDLLHVLTGYRQDWAGETALLAFDHGRGPMLARRVGLFGALLSAPWRNGFKAHRFVLRAWLRGRRSRIPLSCPWERMLERPLEEVRRELAIEPVAVAHPRGILAGGPNSRVWRHVPAFV